MHGLKKLHLLLLPIIISSAISQAAEASILNQRARQHGGWYLELEAFNAKSHDSLLSTLPFAETVIEEEAFLPTIDFFSEENVNHTFDDDFHWGYRAAVGYDFPSCTCCNYGFSLEYTWHRSDEDRHLAGIINSEGAASLDDYYGFFDVNSTNVDADYDYKYHAIDLLGHENTTFCNCIDVQFFAGARYVRLKEELHRHFFVPEEFFDDAFESENEVGELFTDHHTKFDGVGPRVGFNAFYNVACGFGLVTEVAGNLIFGRSDSDYSENVSSVQEDGTFDDVFEGTHETHQGKKGLIVPGLSGKVGLAYHTTFRNCSSLAIEIGYRGDKYFNIANHSALVLPSDFDSSFIKDGNYHDFDISGPYLNVSFHA